ncbi:MAG: sterol desaturase family protein [Bdellovibrionales bacterium]
MKTFAHHTWIEKNRSWIKIFASPHPFLNIAFMLPIIFWLAFTGKTWIITHIVFSACFFMIGLLYWSFIEYFIHRWIYHAQYRNKKVRELVESFHIYHHRSPKDNSVLTAGPLIFFPLALILLMPIWIISLGHQGIFSSISLGVILYYLFYEWVHYSIHRRIPKTVYARWITEYHMFHHKVWNVKYGNTTSLWDHLFRTYDNTGPNS